MFDCFNLTKVGIVSFNIRPLSDATASCTITMDACRAEPNFMSKLNIMSLLNAIYKIVLLKKYIFYLQNAKIVTFLWNYKIKQNAPSGEHCRRW